MSRKEQGATTPAYYVNETIPAAESPGPWNEIFVVRSPPEHAKKSAPNRKLATVIPTGGEARIEYVQEHPDNPGVTIFTWPPDNVSVPTQRLFESTIFAWRLVVVSGSAQVIVTGA